MGFTVDYKELDSIYNNIVDARGSWMTALENIYNAVNAISVSAHINGNGASNVKNYMSTTHGFIIDSLANIIEAHYNNYVLYKQDYHSNIDTALHARILQDELADIGKYMQDVSLPGTVEVDEAIQSALAEVSDLFYSGFPGAQPVEDANLDIQESLVKLDEDITNLENNHQNTDFNEIAELIASLTAFINSQISNGRSYKSTFTVESLRNDSSLARLGKARQTLGDAQAAKNTALVQAFENEQVRQDLLREEREREAAAVNWAVTGLCFVASIGVIVLTGGTATPVVVIATSATTQALSSATQEATAQYVEKGNLSLVDWSDVGEEAFWGGVSGAVTGTMGYYGGELISQGLQHLKPVANLMNSGSKVVRIATNGTIQGINEVGAGIVTRFTGESITNGFDLGAAWEVATDKKSMLIDLGVGLGTGAVKGLSSSKRYSGQEIDGSFADLNTDVEITDLPDGTWQEDPFKRGWIVDEKYNNLGATYPVIDRFDPDTGTITNVKSRDLTGKTYQDGSKLYSVLKKDMDSVADFVPQTNSHVELSASDIRIRRVNTVVPNTTLNQTQVNGINRAITYGKEKGVELIITVGIQK